MYTDKIRELREDKDIRQEDIAKILNRSQQGYSHIENRVARLSIEDLQKLCIFYNVSADYILELPRGLPYPER